MPLDYREPWGNRRSIEIAPGLSVMEVIRDAGFDDCPFPSEARNGGGRRSIDAKDECMQRVVARQSADGAHAARSSAHDPWRRRHQSRDPDARGDQRRNAGRDHYSRLAADRAEGTTTADRSSSTSRTVAALSWSTSNDGVF